MFNIASRHFPIPIKNVLNVPSTTAKGETTNEKLVRHGDQKFSSCTHNSGYCRTPSRLSMRRRDRNHERRCRFSESTPVTLQFLCTWFAITLLWTTRTLPSQVRVITPRNFLLYFDSDTPKQYYASAPPSPLWASRFYCAHCLIP